MEKSAYSSDPIPLSFGYIRMRTEGITEMFVHSGFQLTAENISEYRQAKEKLGGGKPYPNLVLMGAFSAADATAMKSSASSDMRKLRVADAFVIDSLAQRILGNFYLKFNKPQFPTRFFNSKEEALKWLEAFVDQGK
jgi:hypothetical protein